MMTDLTPHQTFLLELQHIIAKHHNAAVASEGNAASLREQANLHQAEAEANHAEAHRWQRLLDFAVLGDHDNDLAHAFANAVLDRGSVDPFANVTTYYAEWQASVDAEAADDAMSASERHEHDQADEAKLDAKGWGQGGAPF